MPSLEELSNALAASIGGADTETAAAIILGHFKIVRAETLREAANGVHEMWENGVPSQEFATRLRFIVNDVPVAVPPADVTRALARAFRMYAKGYRLTAMLVDNGLLENETLDEAGYPKLTILGRTVLSLAEGK